MSDHFPLFADATSGHSNVRIKEKDGVKYVSGIDVVAAVTGQTADLASQTIRRITAQLDYYGKLDIPRRERLCR